MSYLTGFDPRFEEALLLLGPSGDPAILTGILWMLALTVVSVAVAGRVFNRATA